MRTIVFLFLAFVLVSEGIASGSEAVQSQSSIRFTNYDAGSGLPGETVQTIFQDSKGLLWFGVEYEGLVAYDGEAYEIFYHDNSNDQSLSSNLIRTIVEDDENTLWIGTDHGLNRKKNDPLSFSKNEFKRFYSSTENNHSLPANEITTLLVTDQSRLIVGTNKGLAVHLGQDRFKMIPLTPGDEPRIQVLFQTKSGMLYVGTNQGLYQLNHDLEVVTRWDEIDGRQNPSITAIAEVPGSGIWVGAHGIYILDERSKAFTSLGKLLPDFVQFSPVSFTKFTIDKRGRVWVGTVSDGLHIFSLDQSQSTYYSHEALTNGGFRGDQVRDIYQDRSGLTWVAAKNSGLNVHDSRNESFNVLNPFPDMERGNNGILSIAEDQQGNVYLGSRTNGLAILDKLSGQIDHFTIEDGLIDDRIEAIAVKPDGQVVLGTVNGVSFYDPLVSDFTNIGSDPVKSLQVDRKGTIWVGTTQGVYIMPGSQQEMAPISIRNKSDQRPTEISTLLIASDGRLWIGTARNGLWVYDPMTEDLNWFNGSTRDSPFPPYHIRAIYEDREGVIWIGTKLRGLHRYDMDEDSFVHLPDSLFQGSVFDIQGDKDGALWVTTNNHVCRFDPATLEVERFGRAYGLSGIQSSMRSGDDRLFFGGNNNLIFFDPSNLQKPDARTRVSIKSVRSAGTSSTQAGSKYQFPYDTYLTFDFYLADYSSSRANTYEYRLGNLHPDWINAGSGNQVSYANLEPGTYVFSVRGANGEGIWSENIDSLSFVILPPWWLTGWAKFGYVLLILLLFYAIYEILAYRSSKQHEVNLLKLEKEKSEALTQHKLRFFTNISHELRTPLTLLLPSAEKISGTSDLSPELRKHSHVIMRSTRSLLSLIEELIQFRRIEEGRHEFEPVPTNVKRLCEDVFEEFELAAVEKSLEYELREEGIKHDLLLDRNILTKAIRNLISNAIKYTPEGGSVTVRVALRHVSLVIDVIDTGVGISEDEVDHIFDRFYRSENSAGRVVGSGIGLDMVKSLVELHGGTVEVASQKDQGSRFAIKIPVEVKVGEQNEEPDQTDTLRASAGSGVSDQSIHLLIVEDDAEILKMLREMFAGEYEVAIATNGREGLLKALEYPQPNLIISDVVMPEMDGLEFCSQIKKNFKTSHIPVLLLTAKSAISDELAGLEVGADAYVMKPFYPEVLQAKVQSLLKNQKLLKERFSKEMQLNPGEVEVPDPEKEMLDKCVKAIEAHINDQEFGVEVLAKEMGMSRTQLFRKLKYLVDLSPSELIHSVRMKRAADLLNSESLTIAQVAYMTGFSSPKTFGASFRKYFNRSPREFMKGDSVD